jgi:hypothetical protein
MARAVVTSNTVPHSQHEPLYDVDPRTGDSVEVFYADRVLAASFRALDAGWFWWSCQSGSLPQDLPVGPFGTSYAAYRDVATHWTNTDSPTHRASSEKHHPPMRIRTQCGHVAIYVHQPV